MSDSLQDARLRTLRELIAADDCVLTLEDHEPEITAHAALPVVAVFMTLHPIRNISTTSLRRLGNRSDIMTAACLLDFLEKECEAEWAYDRCVVDENVVLLGSYHSCSFIDMNRPRARHEFEQKLEDLWRVLETASTDVDKLQTTLSSHDKILARLLKDHKAFRAEDVCLICSSCSHVSLTS